MNFVKSPKNLVFQIYKNYLKIFTSLTNAILLLGIIAIVSSLGSIIEQDETIMFYQQNYPIKIQDSEIGINPINRLSNFLNWKIICFFGLDHIYTTSWFLFLLALLSISLMTCTFTRQFPILTKAKSYLFKKQTVSFTQLPFFIRFENLSYLKEKMLIKIQQMNFSIYQKKGILYCYKGLIGRISPILVHFSLLIILFSSSFSALVNFKAQEIIPKGELFHIQNTIKSGFFTSLPPYSIRINDFWVEYKNEKIHQFYSNLSILDPLGKEQWEQTISVNNPLRYKTIDFYQSDWNLLGIRLKNRRENKIYEYPLIELQKGNKSWVTWLSSSKDTKSNGLPLENSNNYKETFTLLVNQLQNTKNLYIYNKEGKLLNNININDEIIPNLKFLEILPATGLLIKYDPTIISIYFGFGLLMMTTLFSYLPYTQIWIVKKNNYSLIGSTTNRGKIQLELEFENLLRFIEKKIE